MSGPGRPGLPGLALIALGANLGEPRAALTAARRGLADLGTVERASSLYETAPVGGPPGQPPYLNAVLALRTNLGPAALLSALLDLERRAGRERRERWGPRVLDLDLLALDEQVLAAPDLVLPHPRMLKRAFVLAPLAEIAPAWRHPVAHVTANEALADVGAEGVVRLPGEWS